MLFVCHPLPANLPLSVLVHTGHSDLPPLLLDGNLVIENLVGSVHRVLHNFAKQAV